MAEQTANLAQTTLTANYVAGSGVLTVASTAGADPNYPFPVSPSFRLAIVNSPTTTYPTVILQVTGITDGTHFAVTAEGHDANASSGYTAYQVLSAGALAALLTNPLSGGAFTPINNPNGSSTNWQSTSILTCIRGLALLQYPSSWKIRMRFTAGSPVIGGMVILRTLYQDTSVIDSTTVQIGGVANPTLTTPGVVDTDAISLALDNTHDYWFVIFFTSAGANTTVGVAANGTPAPTGTQNVLALPNFFCSGDQTGASAIPNDTGNSNSPYLVIAGMLP